MHIDCGIYFYSFLCWAAAAICPFSVVGSVEYQSTFEGGCMADLLWVFSTVLSVDQPQWRICWELLTSSISMGEVRSWGSLFLELL